MKDIEYILYIIYTGSFQGECLYLFLARWVRGTWFPLKVKWSFPPTTQLQVKDQYALQVITNIAMYICCTDELDTSHC